MSADNGIFLLKTPSLLADRFEYRVAHCQAIDNLTYQNPEGDPESVVAYFGRCLSFDNEKDAQDAAFEMAKDYHFLEYGISTIELPKSMAWYRDELAKERENDQDRANEVEQG